MGLQIREIIPSKEISIADLKGRVLAVDSHNMLYQFLTTMRQADGTPLTDLKGRITSHLVGLHSRTANLLQNGLKPVFVFDGKPPDLKRKEQERRSDAKKEALGKFEEAKDSEDIAGMKKYGGRTARLDKEMIAEAKRLIGAMGCPIVDAPSEGEAQAAHIAKRGDAHAVVSQDYDSLLYTAPILVRNLSVAGRRKLPGKPVYQNVSPEMIDIRQVLAELGMTPDQLITLAMLVGTDYNLGGIKGIGPKKAIALVKSNQDLDKLFSEAKWSEHFSYPWQDVFRTFKQMPVSDDYTIRFHPPDKDAMVDLLCDEHGFAKERVISSIEGLDRKQKGLSDFF
jgi:flap endonuclease-1